MKVFLTMADTETRFRNLYSVEKIPKFTKVDSANKYTNLHFFSEIVKFLVVFFYCDRENGCRNPPHRA